MMSRYVAFLRGVSPINCKMALLRDCLEQAGYQNVKTILSSGNIAFDTNVRSKDLLALDLEKIIAIQFDRHFPVLVRKQLLLQKLLADDPFAKYKLPDNAKRVVTFLGKDALRDQKLPAAKAQARIEEVIDDEAFSHYVPNPGDPAFMVLIEKTFGKSVTTRTWDTLVKCAKA